MKKYFGVNFLFDRSKCLSIVNNAIKERQKGYVCVVDGNVLCISSRNDEYNALINDSLFSVCDGGSITVMIDMLYDKKINKYTGPELLLGLTGMGYKNLFLGNTKDVLSEIKKYMLGRGVDERNIVLKELPFLNVNEFDYDKIGDDINKISPDIIWVSLGAPKQEVFMSKLISYINSGVMIGIGAALNMVLDEEKNKRAPMIMRNMGLEWFYRILKEPKRIGVRAIKYLFQMPSIIISELKNR